MTPDWIQRWHEQDRRNYPPVQVVSRTLSIVDADGRPIKQLVMTRYPRADDQPLVHE